MLHIDAGAVGQELLRGKRCLSQGRLQKAADCFRRAVERCPVGQRSTLSHALYWLGLSMLRLSRRDIAARSLASAQKLNRRGHARSLYLRITNEYGMPKQALAQDNDRLAFFSIQIASYLRRSSRSSFNDRTERDAVLSSLLGAWKRLSSGSAWATRSCAEKLKSFREARIEYPLNLGHTQSYAEPLVADFRAKRLVQAQDACRCGSGLAFCRCCGRILGIHESSQP